MNETQQSQLKDLITKGKEQGFLTYAQVNDHLPDDIVDPEQIEDIINMINDMGIKVHEVAPENDSLILNDEDAAAADDDETAAEEAAAALAAVETEIGRTTDPVRMYMREMGTVELLTREGEIAIAKRIEEGLLQVHSALSRFPGTYATLLTEYDLYAEGNQRLAEVMIDFIDPEELAKQEIPTPPKPAGKAVAKSKTKDDDSEDEDYEDEEDAEEEEEQQDEGPTGPDPEEVQARFEELAKLFQKFLKLHAKHGPNHKSVDKVRDDMAYIFLRIKYPARMVDHLVDRLRYTISRTRDLERLILRLAVIEAKMPKTTFIKSFSENEADTKWLTPILRGKQKWVPALKERAPEIRVIQKKLAQ
ncbi:MAG: RNA polymerase sigma factor region1.1 domain-containing protein, partial [Xanthomonadales bacterium]|nr:RNA polymerase sigma factor region1.1 domain-containing protein [Xanthomonadales bacterium]